MTRTPASTAPAPARTRVTALRSRHKGALTATATGRPEREASDSAAQQGQGLRLILGLMPTAPMDEATGRFHAPPQRDHPHEYAADGQPTRIVDPAAPSIAVISMPKPARRMRSQSYQTHWAWETPSARHRPGSHQAHAAPQRAAHLRTPDRRMLPERGLAGDTSIAALLRRTRSPVSLAIALDAVTTPKWSG